MSTTRSDARKRSWLQWMALVTTMLLAGENAFGQPPTDSTPAQARKAKTSKSAAKSSSGGSSSSGTSGGSTSGSSRSTSPDGTTTTSSATAGDAPAGSATGTAAGYGMPVPGSGFGPGPQTGTTSELSSAAELLNLALQNNPDIQVARAKVAEAEAELRRIQLQVARQVFTQRQAVEHQRAVVRSLKEEDSATTENLKAAATAATTLVALEAELQFIIGSLPDAHGNNPMGSFRPGAFGGTMTGGFGGAMGGGGFGASGGRMGGFGGGGGGGSAGPFGGSFGVGGFGSMGGGAGRDRRTGGTEAPPALPDEISAERMRENLAKGLRVQFSGSLSKLVEYLNADHGIRFIVDKRRLDNAGVEMEMDIGELKSGTMSLGVLLQLIEDLHPEIAFVVRDYGILITDGSDLPPGSVKVREFRLPEALLNPGARLPVPGSFRGEKKENFRSGGPVAPAGEPRQ